MPFTKLPFPTNIHVCNYQYRGEKTPLCLIRPEMWQWNIWPTPSSYLLITRRDNLYLSFCQTPLTKGSPEDLQFPRWQPCSSALQSSTTQKKAHQAVREYCTDLLDAFCKLAINQSHKIQFVWGQKVPAGSCHSTIRVWGNDTISDVFGKATLLRYFRSQNFLCREGDSRNRGKENLQLL